MTEQPDDAAPAGNAWRRSSPVPPISLREITRTISRMEQQFSSPVPRWARLVASAASALSTSWAVAAIADCDAHLVGLWVGALSPQ